MLKNALLLSSFLTFSASAATINLTDIPNSASCTTTGDEICGVIEQVSTGNLDAVRLVRDNNLTGTQTISWLVRYDLFSPSGYIGEGSYWDTDINGEEYIHEYTYNSPIAGSIWLEAPEQLNIFDINEFTLHSPEFYSETGSYINFDNTHTLGMNYETATSGTGSYLDWDCYSGINHKGECGLTTNLELIDYVKPFSVIENDFELIFQLVGFDYIDGALAFKSNIDSNSLLLSHTDAYNGYSTWADTRQFHVLAAPLPTSIWLFASGLVGLVGFMRRRVQLVN